MTSSQTFRTRVFAAVVALLVGCAGALVVRADEPRNRPGSVLADAIANTCPQPKQGASVCRRCFELQTEFAVLKDLRGQEQLLLIARRDVTGIESPLLQDPWTFNYWAAAWNARRFMTGVPDDDVSLAINSQQARGIDRLHIHVDRPLPAVKRRLQELDPLLGTAWSSTRLTLPPRGHGFWVRKIPTDDLIAKNLFALLPSGLPGADTHPGAYALIVIGGAPLAGGRTGLYLIAGQDSDLGGAAWAEELQQDHSTLCVP